MPVEHIEYSPTENQLTFAQHFIHLSFFNVLFMGFMMDEADFTDFESLMQKDYLIQPPDDINLFMGDYLTNQSGDVNKKRVMDYSSDSFDFVINTFPQINDEILSQGKDKHKPSFLEGHSNLDLILRGESHTAHHRAQAIVCLRMKEAVPPSFTEYNILG